MSRLRRRAVAIAATALTATALGGCGGDDDEPASVSPATEETAAPGTATETEGSTEQEVEPIEPEITDEGHEGGGPDPGTEEAEGAEGHSGGVEAE